MSVRLKCPWLSFAEHSLPELLPCGYLVGENTNITVTLKGTFKTCHSLNHWDFLLKKQPPWLLFPFNYFSKRMCKHFILYISDTLQNSVDALSFETLIPKSIVQRYISLLLEHRRIILCGPSGTGKTFLAQKLAEYLTIK